MRKLLLSLATIAFVFSTSNYTCFQAFAADEEESSDEVADAEQAEKEAQKALKAAKEKAKQAKNKKAEKEKQEKKEKAEKEKKEKKDKAARDKQKKDAEKTEKEFKLIQDKKLKALLSELKDYRKQLDSLRSLTKDVKNDITSANDKKDSLYGSTESRRKSLAVENAMHGVLMVVKPFERGLAEYVEGKEPSLDNIEEYSLQAKSAMDMAQDGKYILALTLYQLVQSYKNNDNKGYNPSEILKALTTFETKLAKKKLGDSILTNYEAVCKAAQDKSLDNSQNAMLQFLEEGKASCKVVSDVYKVGIPRIISFITENKDGNLSNDGSELLDFIKDNLGISTSSLEGFLSEGKDNAKEEKAAESEEEE